MSYSVKMAKLDFYTFKAQFLNYMALAFMIAMFCFMGSSIITLGITAAWYVALVMTNIIVIQEKNNLERLYASLSLDLKNIIGGRYLFVVVMQHQLALNVTCILLSVAFVLVSYKTAIKCYKKRK